MIRKHTRAWSSRPWSPESSSLFPHCILDIPYGEANLYNEAAQIWRPSSAHSNSRGIGQEIIPRVMAGQRRGVLKDDIYSLKHNKRRNTGRVSLILLSIANKILVDRKILRGLGEFLNPTEYSPMLKPRAATSTLSEGPHQP